MKIFAALLALLAATCSQAGAQQVALLTLVNHPVGDALIAGIEDELKKQGHSIKLYNPGGDQAMMQQMARQIAASKPAVAISILTPPTIALRGALRKQGVQVYTGVIEPGLIGDKGNDSSLAGVPTYFNYRQSIALIQRAFPHTKTVGYILHPSEPQAVVAEKKFREEASARGLKLVTIPISGAADLRKAATLAAGADVVLIGSGNVVVSGASTIITAAQQHNKPVFACDEGSIKAGAIAGWTTDYRAAGAEAGKLAAALLAGRGIKRAAFASNNLVINNGSARRAGLDPEKLKMPH